MSIARDMPRIPALQRSAMCDVSCIVGMFIYGIKTVFVHCFLSNGRGPPIHFEGGQFWPPLPLQRSAMSIARDMP